MRYEKPEMDIVEFIENVYMELSANDGTLPGFGTNEEEGGDFGGNS